jgi:hypothetical protein
VNDGYCEGRVSVASEVFQACNHSFAVSKARSRTDLRPIARRKSAAGRCRAAVGSSSSEGRRLSCRLSNYSRRPAGKNILCPSQGWPDRGGLLCPAARLLNPWAYGQVARATAALAEDSSNLAPVFT